MKGILGNPKNIVFLKISVRNKSPTITKITAKKYLVIGWVVNKPKKIIPLKRKVIDKNAFKRVFARLDFLIKANVIKINDTTIHAI